MLINTSQMKYDHVMQFFLKDLENRGELSLEIKKSCFLLIKSAANLDDHLYVFINNLKYFKNKSIT